MWMIRGRSRIPVETGIPAVDVNPVFSQKKIQNTSEIFEILVHESVYYRKNFYVDMPPSHSMSRRGVGKGACLQLLDPLLHCF